MSRLKVNTTVIRDYTWDDKPLETLTRDELLEAVKVLALEAQNKQAMAPYIGRAIAAQRQMAANPCQTP